MFQLFDFCLIAATIIFSCLVLVLFSEIVAAIVLPTPKVAMQTTRYRPRLAVMIPAHNESTGIVPTLADVKAQLLPADRLLVVADNCLDDTAAVAAAAGAETIERHEPKRIGKGYALDFGVRHLSLDPPSVVIVIDADCRVAKDTIDQLALTCASTNRPVQSLYLMGAPINSPIKHRVAEFAWRVKNWVRPLGLFGLGLPCQLMGTGMAFPWEAIRSANLASGSLVEDLKLGIELAYSGSPAIFCPSASVTSLFPFSVGGANSQRARWEHGHVNMILTSVPRLISEGVTRGDLGLIVLALDLAIPPLSLLAILLVTLTFVSGVAALFGLSYAALVVNLASIGVLALATFLSWMKYGRDIVPPGAIAAVPSYICTKLPMYRRLLSGRIVSEWVRTERKKSE